MKFIFKKILSVLLVLALTVSLCTVAMATSNVPNINIDFTTYQGTDLPSGLKVENGTVSVKSGYLELSKGAVLSIDKQNKFSDFTFEVEFTISSYNETTRWCSLMYRVKNPDDFTEKYMQMAVRRSATSSNGVEMAVRHDETWFDNHLGSYTESISSSKKYIAKVVADGYKVAQYLNGTLTNRTNNALLTGSGMFGLQTDGVVMRVYSIKIYEKTKLDSISSEGIRSVYEPDTGIVAAPEVIQNITSYDEWVKLNNCRTPQAAWLNIGSAALTNIQLSDMTVSLTQFLEKCSENIIPVLEVANETTANAVYSHLSQKNIKDVIIASSNINALQSVYNQKPSCITLAYISANGESKKDIAKNAHISGANICVLGNATRDIVEYLQQRFLTVTIFKESVATRTSVDMAVDCGANGVVVSDSGRAYDLYEKVKETTYVRRPFIVGHRGYPAVAPENTVESLEEAFDAGADAVEFDIRLTSDDHVVCIHNSNISSYTSYSTSVSSLTRAQMESYKITKGSHDTSYKDGIYNGTVNFSFFDEMCDALLEEDESKTLVVEIKDSDETTILNKVREIATQKGVLDRIVIIAFSKSAVEKSRQIMPEVGANWLNESSTLSLYTILENTTGYGANIGPDVGKYYMTNVYRLLLRGVSTNFWTVGGSVGTSSTSVSTAIKNAASIGATFLTTNYSNLGYAYKGTITDPVTMDMFGDIEAEGLTLSCQTLNLKEYESSILTANIFPENTTDKTLAWKTDNDSVVTVTQDGTVVANKVGTATVTATTKNGIAVSCLIKVNHDYKTAWVDGGDGFHYHQCAICGEFQTSSQQNHEGGKATCATAAVCEKCGVSYDEKDPGNHEGGTECINMSEATCVKEGYTGDIYCLGCNTEIASGNPIPATGIHIFEGAWLTDPSNSLVSYRVCKDCTEREETVNKFESVLKFLTEKGITKNKMCDVTNDSVVDVRDLFRLKKIKVYPNQTNGDERKDLDLDDVDASENDVWFMRRFLLLMDLDSINDFIFGDIGDNEVDSGLIPG